MRLSTQLFGQHYAFKTITEVLAKANEARSGDRLAGVAAQDARERVAAKQVLSEMRLSELRNHPVIPYEDDCVTRLIQDGVNEAAYRRIQHWSVGELREHLLGDDATPQELETLRKGLTSEMVAAVAKICSNGDLIYGAKKLPVVKRANTTLGLPGRFGCRLQPNDTRDDARSIAAQIFEGLSYGAGDALIGVNPVTDNVDSATRTLNQIYEVIDKFKIPTQGCVLAHISTQMEAVRKGAPIGLLFQSICGSEKGLKEFGISLEMLDEAAEVGRQYSHVAGDNCLYFETGQGSALSANAHHGADQVTMEARNYGLARHYDPFIVNTVVGFIGPEYLYNSREIQRAGLEDHFMGKLSGLSMGCDCCYTNHADADQNSNENLAMLLAAAGCNFVIAMAMGDDIMLNYQTLAFHDIATVRQTLGLRPAPEFERWMETMGLMSEGRLTRAAGDPSFFFG
ncbi:MAG: ethanolamine ammonia-lyase subunit EutB [Rhodoferax sp.]|nr:ethanolamine ammonia-lyase subunit EutB [Rhodoferax sp.]MDP3654857.1 ethanolamine ammonia-lyase subunit EutB [Rhodoferax sp.]